MLMMLRLVKCIIILICVSIPLQLVGAVLLLGYLPYQQNLIKRKPNTPVQLPVLLRWFDCADLYLEFGRTPVTYLFKVVPQGWWVRYCWLAWRNPINYFSYAYLSRRVILRNIDKSKSFEEGDPLVGDSTGDHPGFFHVSVEDFDGQVTYEYYYILKWSATKCCRIRFGHKVGPLKDLKDGQYIQGVIVCQPYRSYGGI
jgi:hypothetical protein